MATTAQAELLITVGERALDVSTETGRLVAADAVQEEGGRDAEVAMLRDLSRPVAVSEQLRVVDPAALAAPQYGRVARPGRPLYWREFCGRHNGELSVAVGDVKRSAKGGGVHLVVETTAPSYWSRDAIEEAEDYASSAAYRDGPGYYGSYTTVPVEETEIERAEREAEEAAAEAKRLDAEAKKRTEVDAWAPVAGLPTVHALPKALLAGVKWAEVFNDRHLSKFGHGTTRSVGTLPDGTLIGHVSSSQYDDWRDWYHVPASLAAAIDAAKAEDARRADRAKAVAAAQAEVDAAVGDDACSSAGWALALKDDAVAATAARYVETGDATALADHRTLLGRVCVAITAERQAAYDAAAAEWLPRITAAIGEAEAREIAGGVLRDAREFASVTDFGAQFEGALADRQKALAEDARKAKQKADRAAARKADPMVTVTGNTYPHRAALQNIPGAKLSKLKGGWTWKVPQSQTGRLPKGLSWE